MRHIFSFLKRGMPPRQTRIGAEGTKPFLLSSFWCGGVVALATSLLMGAITIEIIFSALTLARININLQANSLKNYRAYWAAYSGVEDALLKIYLRNAPLGKYTLSIDDSQVEVTITLQGDKYLINSKNLVSAVNDRVKSLTAGANVSETGNIVSLDALKELRLQ